MCVRVRFDASDPVVASALVVVVVVVAVVVLLLLLQVFLAGHL